MRAEKGRRGWPRGLHDFDGDGALDFLGTERTSFGIVLKGGGDGTFASISLQEPKGQLTSVLAGDFDGDGVLDIVLDDVPAFADSGAFSILTGTGDGTFVEGVRHPHDKRGDMATARAT